MSENKKNKEETGGNKPSMFGTIRTKVVELADKNPLATNILIVILALAVIAGAFYFTDMQSKIYIEKSQINAPIITLAPMVPGQIQKVYVSEGDYVSTGQKLALVGNQEIDAQTAGIITYVNNAPGHISSVQDPVIKMIDPDELRVVGRIQEDKGLDQIKVGQKVTFTVDAFGSQQFEGIVDSIGASARQGDIVFSISDQRQENEFEVKVKYNTNEYPELKDGMSAKMWVYK